MSDSPSSPPRDAPADSERLLRIVQMLSHELRPGVSAIEALGLEHSLERDFGLDSLARVELLARIEREFGIRLAEAAFIEAETPRDLLRQLGGASGSATASRAEIATASAVGIEQPPQALTSLVEILDWRVAQHGDRVHITLHGEDARTEDISYRALRADALSLAGGLRAQGLLPGDRVAIMLPTGREFFAAFYGVLYAACVPVPLYPPARPSQIEDHMRRIAGIVANAEAAALVTDERARLLGHLLRAQCGSLRNITTVAALSGGDAPPVLRRADPQETAFLQYTSGSTGNPKGVVLTHANLRANLDVMARASGIGAQDVFVSWLPLYHDMGLIGACMGSLVAGFRLVLMSPLAFLARPGSWLWAIDRARATVSAAPNFAYELCIDKLDERELDGLDLSCWRLAYNGAEPVSPDTIERFAARFARFGFRANAMTPVYGLAECSLGLTFPPLDRGPLVDRVDRTALSRTGFARAAAAGDARALRLVSCGRPLPEHRIRVVDSGGRELPERTQGRVQFQGPSATHSYFRNPEATVTLVDGEWLNTGDLGYLAAGELYLTGREKDVIIRGGHNIYPQELEEAVSRVPGVRRGGVAVFPAADAHTGTERLVVLAELRDTLTSAERRRVEDEINRLATDLIGLPADDIVLAPARTVPKTSSGKIRRASCRERYEHGTLLAAQRAPWRQLLSLVGSGTLAGAGRLLRHGAGWAWSAWAWLIFAIFVPVAWLLIVLAPALVLRRQIARASARLALLLTGLWPRVEGLRHLAARGPVMVVANHASYLDGLILTAVLPPRFAYVAKQELLRNPLAGIPLRRLGSAFVERFESARGVEDSRRLETRVRDGDSLMFFPEGTFGDAAGLLPFRLGAFVLAAAAGAPVIPVTLTGTRTLLRGESKRPRFSRLAVWVGEPLAPQGAAWEDALRLRDAARRRILMQLGEPDLAT